MNYCYLTNKKTFLLPVQEKKKLLFFITDITKFSFTICEEPILWNN